MSRLTPDPLLTLGYVGSTLDRISEQRSDRALIEAAMRHQAAGVYAMSSETILLARRGATLDPLLSPAEAENFGAPIERIFVGLQNGAARHAIALSSETVERAKAGGFAAIDLRSIAVQGLANDHLPSLAIAKAVLGWHARHRFCPNCGSPTASVEAGWRRDCPNCGMRHFPRTDPCVIMLVIDHDRCLLGRAYRFQPNMWSCLAGFVEPGESFEEAVQRETLEEAGIHTGRISYFTSQPWPFPMSIMVGFHAEAATTGLTIDSHELDGARWFTREEAAAMLAKQHPAGLFTPPSVAIAHHIIRDFVENGATVLER